MPTTIFDLLFLLTALFSILVLVALFVLAVQKRRTLALKIARRYTILLAIYGLTGVSIAYVKPQRLASIGAPWCFDDWCLTVVKVSRSTGSPDTIHRIDFEISSRAQRITQRANYAWIYLLDEKGNRYSPETDPTNVPLEVPLGPAQIVTASRTFRVPRKVQQLSLVTGHGSPYCGAMSFLVLGESGCLFNKPTAVPIHLAN